MADGSLVEQNAETLKQRWTVGEWVKHALKQQTDGVFDVAADSFTKAKLLSAPFAYPLGHPYDRHSLLERERQAKLKRAHHGIFNGPNRPADPTVKTVRRHAVDVDDYLTIGGAPAAAPRPGSRSDRATPTTTTAQVMRSANASRHGSSLAPVVTDANGTLNTTAIIEDEVRCYLDFAEILWETERPYIADNFNITAEYAARRASELAPTITDPSLIARAHLMQSLILGNAKNIMTASAETARKAIDQLKISLSGVNSDIAARCHLHIAIACIRLKEYTDAFTHAVTALYDLDVQLLHEAWRVLLKAFPPWREPIPHVGFVDRQELLSWLADVPHFSSGRLRFNQGTQRERLSRAVRHAEEHVDKRYIAAVLRPAYRAVYAAPNSKSTDSPENREAMHRRSFETSLILLNEVKAKQVYTPGQLQVAAASMVKYWPPTMVTAVTALDVKHTRQSLAKWVTGQRLAGPNTSLHHQDLFEFCRWLLNPKDKAIVAILAVMASQFLPAGDSTTTSVVASPPVMQRSQDFAESKEQADVAGVWWRLAEAMTRTGTPTVIVSGVTLDTISCYTRALVCSNALRRDAYVVSRVLLRAATRSEQQQRHAVPLEQMPKVGTIPNPVDDHALVSLRLEPLPPAAKALDGTCSRLRLRFLRESLGSNELGELFFTEPRDMDVICSAAKEALGVLPQVMPNDVESGALTPPLSRRSSTISPPTTLNLPPMEMESKPKQRTSSAAANSNNNTISCNNNHNNNANSGSRATSRGADNLALSDDDDDDDPPSASSLDLTPEAAGRPSAPPAGSRGSGFGNALDVAQIPNQGSMSYAV